jgi:hypothetical protein
MPIKSGALAANLFAINRGSFVHTKRVRSTRLTDRSRSQQSSNQSEKRTSQPLLDRAHEDEQALETIARAWDRIANEREASLLKQIDGARGSIACCPNPLLLLRVSPLALPGS